jgi:hypothetical protein
MLHAQNGDDLARMGGRSAEFLHHLRPHRFSGRNIINSPTMRFDFVLGEG